MKLVDQLICLGSSITSTVKNINIWLSKASTTINSLLPMWKSDISDKKEILLSRTRVSSTIGLHDVDETLEEKTTWNLHKYTECTFEPIFAAAPYKIALVQSLPSHQASKQDMLGSAEESRKELINDDHLWSLTHRNTSVGRLAEIYMDHLYKYTECCLEKLLEAMDDRDG